VILRKRLVVVGRRRTTERIVSRRWILLSRNMQAVRYKLERMLSCMVVDLLLLWVGRERLSSGASQSVFEIQNHGLGSFHSAGLRFRKSISLHQHAVVSEWC